MPKPNSTAQPRSTAICAHTEFEADCDCGCGGYQGDPNHECDWPDCGCGCSPDCVGCRLAQEAAA